MQWRLAKMSWMSSFARYWYTFVSYELHPNYCVHLNWDKLTVPPFFCHAKVIITSKITARFLHKCIIKSCTLKNHKIDPFLNLLLIMHSIRSVERLNKNWRIKVNPFESVAIITTVYYNNNKILFSQIFKGLLE